MKKMLVRSGQAPWDIVDPVEMMKRDTIGRNVGNFVYAYSVFRNLYSEDVDLVSDNYSTDIKKADYINENYDAYVLPLANGFRQSFIPTLRRYTALIKKLKIPVYVIGIGVQAPYEIDVKKGFSFDNDVKEFVSTVLDHSSMLGLRGQITSDYLSALGFKEGRDHTVIGCPSMYTFGDNINIRSLNLTSESKINTSLTPSASQNVVSFIHSLFDNYENACYIPQDTEELVMAYSGAPMYGGTAFQAKTFDYPSSINSKEYKEDRMKFFLSAKTWFDHVKQSDFNIGTRLHGNIVSTINGTPSISIPIDARMRELTEYHNLTRILPNEIKEDDKLEDLIDRVDFRSAEKVHHRNFENFVSFLDENKIIHTYRENTPGVPKHLDKRLENTDLLPPVTSITGVTSVSEIQKRISHGFDDLRDKQVTILNRQNAREKKLKEENAKLKKQNIQLNKKAAAPATDEVNLDVKTIVNLSEDIKIKNEVLSKKDAEIKALKSKLSDIKSILD
ncbi:polysaccharide pyruvyl transferase family protein [Enterococcus lactis]|uniref:polysaccharide pyruvyl transferase family protein n=1 Tax=Enterococcus lactis TaxID=357441 RepID=UPI001A10A151